MQLPRIRRKIDVSMKGQLRFTVIHIGFKWNANFSHNLGLVAAGLTNIIGLCKKKEHNELKAECERTLSRTKAYVQFFYFIVYNLCIVCSFWLPLLCLLLSCANICMYFYKMYFMLVIWRLVTLYLAVFTKCTSTAYGASSPRSYGTQRHRCIAVLPTHQGN